MERIEPAKPVIETPQSGREKGGGRAVGAALLFLAIYFLVQLIVTIPYVAIVAARIIRTEGMGSVSALVEEIMLAVMSGGELLTGLIDLLSLGAFALTLKLMRRDVLASAGLLPVKVARLIPLIPLGAALNVLLTSLLSLLPADALTAYMEASSPVLLGSYGILSVLILTLLAPLTEEVLFRGLIYGNLKRALPRWLAIVLASAVFGLMHGQILWMAYTAALGALFCVVRDRYETLWASVALHMSFNAGSYLVLQMQNTPLSTALFASGAVALACLMLVCRAKAPEEQGNSGA